MVVGHLVHFISFSSLTSLKLGEGIPNVLSAFVCIHSCVRLCLQYVCVSSSAWMCICVYLNVRSSFRVSVNMSFCVCASWFEMLAFNSHPLWFLLCSAQGEADSANLSLLCRWSEIQVSPQNKTGKLLHTA